MSRAGLSATFISPLSAFFALKKKKLIQPTAGALDHVLPYLIAVDASGEGSGFKSIGDAGRERDKPAFRMASFSQGQKG